MRSVRLGHYRGCVFMLLLPLFATVGTAQAQVLLPHAQAIRIRTPETLDGRLDEPCWSEAPSQTGFRALSGRHGEAERAEQTSFRVVFDDTCLYFGITCHEPQMNNVIANITERDGPVWQDDCVEILLQPGKRFYYHFVINTRGAMYDARLPVHGALTGKEESEGPLWDGAWEAAVHRGAAEWTIEARIPWATLDLAAETLLSSWRLNVGRTVARRMAYSAWAPVVSGYHDLPLFGYLDGVNIDTSRYCLDGSNLRIPHLLVGSNRVNFLLPARRSGQFRVCASLRSWQPGPLPQRGLQTQTIETKGGGLPVTLTLPVTRAEALQEFILEVDEAASGTPVLLSEHLFRAPQPFDASLDWAVYYDADRNAKLNVSLAVAPDSAHGAITARLLGERLTSRIERVAEIKHAGSTLMPIPLAGLPEGLYRIDVTASLPEVGRFQKELTFYKTTGPFEAPTRSFQPRSNHAHRIGSFHSVAAK